MKKLVFIFSVLVISGCNSFSNKAEMAGKWEVADFEFITEETEIPAEMGKILLSTTYVFNSDSSMVVNSDIHDDVRGTYEIKKDSLILKYFWGGRNAEEHFRIAEMSPKEIILKQEFEEGADFVFRLKRD